MPVVIRRSIRLIPELLFPLITDYMEEQKS
jgi:hypothetical protein